MARYHVFSATHQYYGEAYAGSYLKDIDMGVTLNQAEFKDFASAKTCADKLHEVCDIGWIVYNAFSEMQMYDTRTSTDESVNT